MEVRPVSNKKNWTNFLKGVKEKTFLHSWNWGEFQKKLQNNIWRLGIYDSLDSKTKKSVLVGVALVIKIEAKRGNFLFVPHGPITKTQDPKQREEILRALVNYLKEIASKERVSFFRIAPLWKRTPENIKIFQDTGFRKAPIHMHPEVTWELDITPLEDDILMNMRKNTRYLVRKALKNKDIEVQKSKSSEDLSSFYRLIEITAQRKDFVPFSPEYIRKEFNSFRENDQILIFLGKYKGEIVSSSICVFWQDIAFYHHGASSLKYPKIPVSNAVQWEIIREAKGRGCHSYNFWGIADIQGEYSRSNPEFKNHPWCGLTVFKRGFGGRKKSYVRTQDFTISFRYWLNWIVEKIRKKKRGF